MAREIQVGRGTDQADVTEQTATSIPARIPLRHCRGTYYQLVLASTQQPCDVQLETHVSVVCSSDVLAVQPHVAHQHDAFEVEQQATVLQLVLADSQRLPIPALAHLLEATGRQTTLDIGGHVGVVGFLVGRGWNPGLLYLEIMRHVNHLHAAKQRVARKLPAVVQRRQSLRSCGAKYKM